MRDLTNEGKKSITPIGHGGVLPRTDTLGSGKTVNTPNLRPNLGTCCYTRPRVTKICNFHNCCRKRTPMQFWGVVIKPSKLQIQICSPLVAVMYNLRNPQLRLSQIANVAVSE